MKLLRHIQLELRDDAVKVYEVELCELSADQWVVNFRYGRKGTTLREGTRTELPVSREEAERAFERLVASRRAKGYVDADDAPESPPEAATEALPADDERATALRRGLDDPDAAWTDLDGVIVRVGELRISGCTDRLVARLPDAPDKTAYNIVRALLRCGDATAVPALHAIWESERPHHVRMLAAHAVVELAPTDARERFVASQAARLPPALTDALARGDIGTVERELREQPVLFERLYLVHREAPRGSWLALLRALSVAPPLWQAVRGVFRAAEARSDGAVYGILAHRIRRTRATPRDGFGPRTKEHFIRRTWRIPYRLGAAGQHADYTALAAGILLAVTDDERGPASQWSRWDYKRRASVTRHGAPFYQLWAFNHVLYQHCSQREANPRGGTWRLAPGVSPDQLSGDVRTEAFPEAWDAFPERLVDLLVASRCDDVHTFGARALGANQEVWPGITLEQLSAMLAAPYPQTGDLCVQVAQDRYDPAVPDRALVACLVDAAHAPARALAHQWVREQPGPFLAHAEFLILLVLSPQADTRALALEVLGAGAVPAPVGSEVVAAVLAFAQGATGSTEAEIGVLNDAAVLLQAAFPAEVREIPLAVLVELVDRRVEAVAGLGARLLLGHAVPPEELPDELLVALITSPYEGVRGVGLRLYAQLDVPTLLERFRVLCDLLTHPEADVRHGARPVVVKVVQADPGAGDRLVHALLPALVIEGPEGMHASLVECLREDLGEACGRLDTASILRLVGATESVVQALGGDLLKHVDAGALTVPQLVTMGGSDILSIREAAWELLRQRSDDARSDPTLLLPLFDAAWDDTRTFAMSYVDDAVGVDALHAELVIGICDSVRPDVQAWGRRTITRMFETEQGPNYLLKLSEHPDLSMQQFVSTWLSTHAAGEPDRLYALVPFFVGVVTQPNRGRVAKTRVLAFLAAEAEAHEDGARVALDVATQLSASEAVTYRAWAIKTLAAVRRRWPELSTPLTVHEPEVRDAV